MMSCSVSATTPPGYTNLVFHSLGEECHTVGRDLLSARDVRTFSQLRRSGETIIEVFYRAGHAKLFATFNKNNWNDLFYKYFLVSFATTTTQLRYYRA